MVIDVNLNVNSTFDIVVSSNPAALRISDSTRVRIKDPTCGLAMRISTSAGRSRPASSNVDVDGGVQVHVQANVKVHADRLKR